MNADSLILNYLNLEAIASIVPTYFALYGIGARVHIVESAREGKLESVVIKQHIINTSGEITYKDTLNRIWIVDELCSQANAREYALIYWESLAEGYLHA